MGSTVKLSAKKQDKEYERLFFDEVADLGDYDTFEEGFYMDVLEEASFLHADPLVIMDAGTGSGAFAKRIAGLGHTVVGVDISPKMIDVLNASAKDNLTGIVGDLEDCSIFPPEHFDAIFCGQALHHLPDPSQVIKNFSYWIKPSGRLILLEPNGSNPIWRISSFLGIIVAALIPKLRTKIRSRNEINHSFKKYRLLLEDSGLFKIDKVHSISPTFQTGRSFLGVLVLARAALFWVNRVMLPEPYKGTELLIIATEQNAVPN